MDISYSDTKPHKMHIRLKTYRTNNNDHKNGNQNTLCSIFSSNYINSRNYVAVKMTQNTPMYIVFQYKYKTSLW